GDGGTDRYRGGPARHRGAAIVAAGGVARKPGDHHSPTRPAARPGWRECSGRDSRVASDLDALAGEGGHERGGELRARDGSARDRTAAGTAGRAGGRRTGGGGGAAAARRARADRGVADRGNSAGSSRPGLAARAVAGARAPGDLGGGGAEVQFARLGTGGVGSVSAGAAASPGGFDVGRRTEDGGAAARTGTC